MSFIKRINAANRVPIVGIPTRSQATAGGRLHCIHDQYVYAMVQAAGCMPMMIPSLPNVTGAEEWLDVVDGIVLTGARSRLDDLTLQLAQAAFTQKVPIMGICGGCRDLNTALGGTTELYSQALPRQLAQFIEDSDLVSKYTPVHSVEIVSGGVLDRLLGMGSFMVSSVRRPKIALLGSGLRVEAHSPDGKIEAISAQTDHGGFVIGIEWHPVQVATATPISLKLFKAFSNAVSVRYTLRSRLI